MNIWRDRVLPISVATIFLIAVVKIMHILYMEGVYPNPDTKYHMRVKSVDGSWSDTTFILPHTAKFNIRSSDGCYSLQCKRSERDNLTLMEAVIDYKLVLKETLDTTSKEIHVKAYENQ